MTLIEDLKDRRERQMKARADILQLIEEQEDFVLSMERELDDLDTAIAALEPASQPHETFAETVAKLRAVTADHGLSFDAFVPNPNIAALEPAPAEPEAEPSLFDAEPSQTEAEIVALAQDEAALLEDDAPSDFISDLTGDPAIEPETGLHSDPEPTELDAPASVLNNPELLAAVERAEQTLRQEEPAAYVGLNDPELDDAWDAMKAREEAEKPRPRFSIFGLIKEPA
jgi:hypothetical protein